MRTLAIATILCAATTASAEVIRHVPPGDVEAGKQLELVAEAPANMPTLVAHVRPHGASAYTSIELVRRDDAHWVAVVPAVTVEPPGLDYYLTSGDQPAFASPDWPHTTQVRAAPEDERRGRDLVRIERRRSKVNTQGEWVEYGKRDYGDAKDLPDHYYRIDGDFSYRLLTYPLEEIRVGGTYMIGQTLAAPDHPCATPDACADKAGMKAGWFELGLAAIEGVRLDARMIAMATAQGFAVGGRGEARLGARDASHVAIGAEYLADVGANGFFRLGWGTVPKLPMAATVEVTNLPASHRETGVRLYYDVAREVAPGFRLGLRVGYAARTQSVAGFTGGAGASVEF
jgi:hypothetical protein